MNLLKLDSQRKFLAAVLFLTISTSAYSMAAWDRSNRPELMDNKYNRVLNQLPVSGKLSNLPWSDDYWPTYRGGISFRWNQKGENEVKKYGYELLNSNKISNSLDTSKLSPSEKYDLFIGRYDFPLTKQERERTSILATIPGSTDYDKNFEIPRWEGLCHAWAPATMQFNNPKPITVVNKDGISIKFGSSDLKALLTYFLHSTKSKTYFLGSRCELSFDELKTKVANGEMSEEEMYEQMNSPECADTNAGAFHIALVNQIGLKNEGFVVDVTRDAEVWNQPVYAFRTKIISTSEGSSEGAAPNTVKEVTVETEMDYISEIKQTWNYIESHNSVETKIYKYRLELNAEGKIIGGEWLDENRLDFIWKSDRPDFQGFFAPLKDLYEKATK
ncbi:MAG: hypothetical protein HQK51_17800 [Oligoflexia bacterium]|nr:hypothetical protein [Oligoflexia bacterium]